MTSTAHDRNVPICRSFKLMEGGTDVGVNSCCYYVPELSGENVRFESSRNEKMANSQGDTRKNRGIGTRLPAGYIGDIT